MPAVNQFAYVPETGTYQFGHDPILKAPAIPITGAPEDVNWRRFAMLHDDSAYRLYFFRGSTADTLYQFGFDGSAFVHGHISIPVMTLEGAPEDADASSFAMLHDGSVYRLYLRQLGNPRRLYQFAWVAGSTAYRFGHRSMPEIEVTGFPADADWSRWQMLHDGSAYRIYTFKLGSNTQLYQGAWNPEARRYEFDRADPGRSVTGAPEDSDLSSAAMLHDGSAYRFYFKTL